MSSDTLAKNKTRGILRRSRGNPQGGKWVWKGISSGFGGVTGLLREEKGRGKGGRTLAPFVPGCVNNDGHTSHRYSCIGSWFTGLGKISRGERATRISRDTAEVEREKKNMTSRGCINKSLRELLKGITIYYFRRHFGIYSRPQEARTDRSLANKCDFWRCDFSVLCEESFHVFRRSSIFLFFSFCLLIDRSDLSNYNFSVGIIEDWCRDFDILCDTILCE